MSTDPMSELDAHRQNYHQLGNGVPAFVRALRERGFDRFAALGMPTTRLEDWKYTDLATLRAQRFHLPGPTPPPAALAQAAAERLDTGIELVFVNGSFVPALSRPAALPDGAVVGSLATALREQPDLVEPHLGRYAAIDDDGLAALNTAFIRDGAFVLLPPDTDLALPIHCLFLCAPTDGAIVVHPRNLIVLGARSRATVIEQYVGIAGAAYWTNAVSELALAAGATVAHARVQREGDQGVHIASVASVQAADSRFDSFAASLGAALSRTAIATSLAAPGAACALDGLYLAGGTQHVDHHTTIDHREPRGTSRELYKGILDGRATGVFNGKVFVRLDAQQSDAQQMNKNLLLSDDAQIDTKPQLEIFADDVKCSHGAAIGQLDDDALFYLRARGIGADEARQVLVYAFANELLDRVAVAPLRAQLGRALDARLHAQIGDPQA